MGDAGGHGYGGTVEGPEDITTALWRETVEALIAKGATPAEAIDGANLIVAAYRRKCDEKLPDERPSDDE